MVLLPQNKWIWRTLIACASLTILLGTCLLIWWNSTGGQIYRINKELLRSSDRISDDETLRQVAEASAFVGKFTQAHQIASRIGDPHIRAKSDD